MSGEQAIDVDKASRDDANRDETNRDEASRDDANRASPRSAGQSGVPLIRCGIAGVLMGLANLVPGVSGGTMILIMGLYYAFISAIADATRGRFTRRGVVTLGVVGAAAGVTIVSLAKPMAALVLLHRLAMYALFIGMTLGGVGVLWRMMRPLHVRSAAAIVVGFVLMIAVAGVRPDEADLSKDEKAKIEAMIGRGEFPLYRAYGLDLAAGVLGISAMVLPGISGAYLLLLLGRYEQVLGAVAMTKEYALSFGHSGDASALHVIVPVAAGAVVGLVGVTNALKWCLRHHADSTVGFLLGVLVGSAVMLWRMMKLEEPSQFAQAGLLLVIGLGVTWGLSRIGARRGPDERRAPRAREGKEPESPAGLR